MHTLHSQPAFLAGADMPAAPQLKALAGAGAGVDADAAGAVGAVGANLGRGSSHAGHCALSGSFVSMQTPHVQLSAGLAAGGLTPAIAQLKPAEGFALGAGGAGALAEADAVDFG